MTILDLSIQKSILILYSVVINFMLAIGLFFAK